MSRPGITKDQVFAAAEALAAEGENPTVTRIRTKLSGGSQCRTRSARYGYGIISRGMVNGIP